MKKMKLVVVAVLTAFAFAACSVDDTDKTYSVRFDVAGYADDIATVTKQDGDTFTEADLPTPEHVRDGYRLEAWYTDAEYTTAFATFKVTGDTTLYAKFVSLSQTTTQYAVKFDVAGLAEAISSIHKNLGEEFTNAELPTPINVKAGFTFDAWYMNAACTEAFKTFEVTEHTTLYAKFTSSDGKSLKVISYVTAYSYKDTLRTLADELPPSCLGAPPTSVEDDYYFRGWYTSDADNAEKAESGMAIEGNGITLYAKWEKMTADTSVTFEGLQFSDMNYVYARSDTKDEVTTEYKYAEIENLTKKTNYYLITGVSKLGADDAQALVFCKSMGNVVLRSDSTDGRTVTELRLGNALNASKATAVDTLMSYVQICPTGAGTVTATLTNVKSSSVETKYAKALFIDKDGIVIHSKSIDNSKDADNETYEVSFEVSKAGPIYLAFGRYEDTSGQLGVKKIVFTAN